MNAYNIHPLFGRLPVALFHTNGMRTARACVCDYRPGASSKCAAARPRAPCSETKPAAAAAAAALTHLRIYAYYLRKIKTTRLLRERSEKNKQKIANIAPLPTSARGKKRCGGCAIIITCARLWAPLLCRTSVGNRTPKGDPKPLTERDQSNYACMRAVHVCARARRAFVRACERTRPLYGYHRHFPARTFSVNMRMRNV